MTPSVTLSTSVLSIPRPKYIIHRRDRPSIHDGGGVIVAVNSDFISTREDKLELSSSEAISIKLR